MYFKIKMNEIEQVSASAVANKLIDIAKSNDKSTILDNVTNLLINKTIYFVHGFYLLHHNQPVINVAHKEYIEAWKYGPVVPSIYHEFKRFGKDIVSDYSIVDEETETDGTRQYIHKLPNNGNIVKIFDWFLDNFLKTHRAEELVSITHVKNSPWYNVYHQDDARKIIDNDIITPYFEKYSMWLEKERGIKYTS